MAVTAAMVKELREITGSGMMDCKKALVEVEGDIDKAIEWLRENGLSKAAKKSDRVAAEGLVRVDFSDDHKKASIVEVNSETDFVAKNEEFIGFVEDMAKQVLNNGNMTVEEFMDSKFDNSTVKETLTAKIAKIGENMNIRRFEKLDEPGVVYTGYTHGGGRIGVVVGIKTDASADEVSEVGKDVAMQVASMNPQFVNEDAVDQKFLAHEKEIITQQIINEGKKAELVEKIAIGKIKKELKEICLVDQPFVKDSDMTVGQYVDSVAKKIGKDMKVVSMTRFEVGEGIEKKEENFADEVAAQINK